ncbi:MAG: FAD:protein FMN transferase [Acidiferrobacterales bacterium]
MQIILSKKYFFLIFVLLTASSCSKPVVTKFERCNIFGACINVEFESKTSGTGITATIENDLDYLVSILNPVNSKPMLRLNSLLRSGEWASVNPSVFTLVTKSKEYYKSSLGYFDPARNGLLIKLWKIAANAEPGMPSLSPSKKAYESVAQTAATMDDIELQGIRVRSTNTNIALDFGTLLHGYTVDMVFDYLKSTGAKNIRVVLGNTIRISTKENTPRIESISPLHGKTGATTVTMKNGEALCVSRLHDNDAALGGPRYTTIFNPKTGKPAPDTGAVIVIHQNAMIANAACQALFNAGPTGWQKVDKSMQTIASLYLSTTGKLQMKMPMLQRIELNSQKNRNKASQGERK